MEAIGRGPCCSRVRAPTAGSHVEHDDVDGTTLQEGPRHRERLVHRFRHEHDEPVEANPARHGLDGIERSGEIHPGHERPCRLGLGDEPQGERRGSGRARPAKRDRRREGDAAGAEDRVQVAESGRDDALPAAGLAFWLDGREGDHGECTVDVRSARPSVGIDRAPIGLARPQVALEPPRSCRTPARPEGRESGGDVRGRGRHGTSTIEQTFDPAKGRIPRRAFAAGLSSGSPGSGSDGPPCYTSRPVAARRDDPVGM